MSFFMQIFALFRRIFLFLFTVIKYYPICNLTVFYSLFSKNPPFMTKENEKIPDLLSTITITNNLLFKKS